MTRVDSFLLLTPSPLLAAKAASGRRAAPSKASSRFLLATEEATMAVLTSPFPPRAM